MADEFHFYRLATIGWANPLIRATVPLLHGEAAKGVVLDLSKLEFVDSFGITYLAACFHVVTSSVPGFVRRARKGEVNAYLQDVGLYESIGLGDKFRA